MKIIYFWFYRDINQNLGVHIQNNPLRGLYNVNTKILFIPV